MAFSARHFSPFLPFVVHASFYCALAFMSGIVWQATHYSLLWLGIPLFFGVLGLHYCKRKKLANLLLLSLASFILGGVRYQHKQNSYRAFSAPKEAHYKAVIEGNMKTGNRRWPYQVQLQMIETITPETSWPCSFSVYIYTKNNIKEQIGDVIFYKASPLKQPRAKEFGGYLLKEGAIGTAFVPFFEPELLYRPRFSWTRWADQTTERLYASLKKKMSRPCFACFSSLFMGDKSRVKESIEGQKPFFKVWGISHHLARSGLHLMIFILAWHLLLSVLPLPFLFKNILIVILTCIYYILTPPSISFIRAFLLLLFYKFCSFFDWQINPVHLISVVCFLTLLVNPLQLFYLDFQLSFYLTFCLAWLSHLNRQRKQFS